MKFLTINQPVDRIIQNISKINKPFCGTFHFAMANNLITQQVQELQQKAMQAQLLDPIEETESIDMDVNSKFSNDSIISEILANSLTSPKLSMDNLKFQTEQGLGPEPQPEPETQPEPEPILELYPQPKVETAKSSSSRISFRTLVHLVMVLNDFQRKASACHQTDISYWRHLAHSYSRENDRYQRVIEIQRKRISTLERDLRALVKLARETQGLLADISSEKRTSEERGHGEHPD